MIAWNALALELLKYGFHAVQFIEVTCPDCGEWRVAVPEAPPDTFPCPNCASPRPAGWLCGGFTRRELPFSEQVALPLSYKGRNWMNADDRTDELSEGEVSAAHWRKRLHDRVKGGARLPVAATI